MSVWVIDDSRLIRSMLTTLLAQAGIEDVHTADSGEGLVQALQDPEVRDQVRLILLDLMMPGMDGIATLRHIRSFPELQDIPVIIITGRGEKEDLEAAFHAGASDFLSKPADPVEFVARVKGALRLSELLIQRRSREQNLKDSHAHMERLSLTDPLTHVANRRQLDQQLQNLWLQEQRKVSLILLDVDHFKRYNDALGHLEGDKCLKKIASILQDTLEKESTFIPESLLARYGGEEFAVLLPDAGLQEAAQLAEHLRVAVLNAALPHPTSESHHVVTLSLGVGETFTGLDTSAAQLVENTDAALYQAKRLGRNQVIRTDQLEHLSEDLKLHSTPLKPWKKVLLVDDSSLVRSFLRHTLKHDGAEVIEAASVPAALQHLPEISQFELVVLDLNLEERSGLEVLKQIRAINQSVVVVVFSGKDPRGLQEALSMGADAYLSKGDFDLQGKDVPAFMQALNHAREFRQGMQARELLRQVQLDFFAVFAHDLKNPISALGLAVDMAAESRSLDDLRPLLSNARDAKTMLLDIMGQYQEFLRLQTHQAEVRPVPTRIGHFLAEVLDGLQLQMLLRQQHFDLNIQPEVKGVQVLLDRKVMYAALQSALISMMKHAPDQSTIHVNLSLEGNHVRLTLQDPHSRILPEEMNPLLYSPSLSHKWYGAGVSLPLLRVATEANGGRLWAETRAGLAQFVAEWPAHPQGPNT
ncbi:response regulator [Deinococcus misasensis]|uniref:response regulator n=1 Tax=Deinococcus misasensis TaxID=392413 RepID=UPI0006903139|nr:response regulator [Deinococcus misasensis]